jgi:predicted dienelactone hydrolase
MRTPPSVAAWLLLTTFAAGQAEAPALAPAKAPSEGGYDPLHLQAPAATSLRLTVADPARQRDVPVRVYLPAGDGTHPVVLCSHGLGGTRDTYAYLGEHWARRGYVVVAMQHPGSDDSVWRDLPLRERMAAMHAAANGRNLTLRCEDVRAVLDALAVWHADAGHPCRGRLDLEHTGMSGHSFGAYTTQFTTGQAMPLFGAKWTDPRLRAALAMSPSSPRAGSAEAAFAGVAVPWLLMTGTHDDSRIGDQTAASRCLVFPALPTTIDRYELVLDGAEHHAFADVASALGRRTRDPNHHRAIQALSTAFWDTHLRGDDAARAWLHGAEARSVLADADRWQAMAAVAPAGAAK